MLCSSRSWIVVSLPLVCQGHRFLVSRSSLLRQLVLPLSSFALPRLSKAKQMKKVKESRSKSLNSKVLALAMLVAWVQMILAAGARWTLTTRGAGQAVALPAQHQ